MLAPTWRGAFSGTPHQQHRSGAYMARYIAKNLCGGGFVRTVSGYTGLCHWASPTGDGGGRYLFKPERSAPMHWKSRYLIKVEGMKFVDAVLALCDECPGYIRLRLNQKKAGIHPPPAAANNSRVLAYLLKRGISRGVIEACVRAGILYESADYHNAVFVGRDETGTSPGTPSCAAPTHGENPSRQRCRAAISGFASCCRRRGKTNRVAVYEAAIEPMAHLTLEGATDKWRLSSAASMRRKKDSGRNGRPRTPLRWTLFSGAPPGDRGNRDLHQQRLCRALGSSPHRESLSGPVPHGEEPAQARGL